MWRLRKEVAAYNPNNANPEISKTRESSPECFWLLELVAPNLQRLQKLRALFELSSFYFS